MLRRSVLLFGVSVCCISCEGNATPEPVAVESSPEAKPDVPSASKGPPLAKNDPRFHKYVPKPTTPLDFSGVDVGDEALEGAPQSLEDLGAALVEALNAKDAERLRALEISESEYKDRFFPILIYKRSALKLGAELGWKMLRSESDGDLDNALSRLGGKSLDFVSLSTDEVLDRPKVRIHRKCVLRVRALGGDEKVIPLAGTILEHTPSKSFRVVGYTDH